MDGFEGLWEVLAVTPEDRSQFVLRFVMPTHVPGEVVGAPALAGAGHQEPVVVQPHLMVIIASFANRLQ